MGTGSTSIVFPKNEQQTAQHVTAQNPLPVTLSTGNFGSSSLFGEAIRDFRERGGWSLCVRFWC